jgi:hypothetical protein
MLNGVAALILRIWVIGGILFFVYWVVTDLLNNRLHHRRWNLFHTWARTPTAFFAACLWPLTLVAELYERARKQKSD